MVGLSEIYYPERFIDLSRAGHGLVSLSAKNQGTLSSSQKTGDSKVTSLLIEIGADLPPRLPSLRSLTFCLSLTQGEKLSNCFHRNFHYYLLEQCA